MYNEFTEWLDDILEKELPFDGVALNFNLYENVDNYWSIQLVTTESFDIEDDDWVCDEVFTTGEDMYFWQQETGWEEILELAKQWMNQYLENGKYADDLKMYEAVGIGFVDGDIDILYQK